MSMFNQLRDLVAESAKPKPIRFAAKNPELKGHTLSLKLEAPSESSDEAIAEAAALFGVSASERVPVVGGSETRGRETATGMKAVSLVMGFRYGPQAAKVAAEAALDAVAKAEAEAKAAAELAAEAEAEELAAKA